MRAEMMMGWGRGTTFGRQPATRASSARLDTDTPGMSDAFAVAMLVVLPRIGDAVRLGLKAAPAGIAVVLIAIAINAMLPDKAGMEPRAAAPTYLSDPEATGSIPR